MHFSIQIILGLICLVLGADRLVSGASKLARWMGLSSLVIGLTVVALGTSAPEIVVSTKAVLAGQADLGVGNVVGSNIFNVLLILGLTSLIKPLTVARAIIRTDVPVMIGASGLCWFVVSNGQVSVVEGCVLLLLSVGYTSFLIFQCRRENNLSPEPATSQNLSLKTGSIVGSGATVIFGLILLGVGGQFLVEGSVAVARQFGLSELMIGLTIVSAGTSLPEVATSLMAVLKGEGEMAVGNVVGSNIYNVLLILGATSLFSGGIRVSDALIHFDLPVMVAVAILCLPLFITGSRLSRFEGALLLLYYSLYFVFLILKDSEHEMFSDFTTWTLWFALPISLIGVGVSVYYACVKKDKDELEQTCR